MIDYNELIEKGKEAGFTHIVPLDVSTIELLPEVREMCAKCSQYGKRWACPPACGSLEECRERLSQWTKGILVQTVGTLEDVLDGEGMMETQEQHKETFLKFTDYLYDTYGKVLPIGTGICEICSSCTYPDEPCRFPEKATSSMEAFGMVVSQVCKANNLPYYYGECTIAYTSCYLLE